jgi:uracil-DNA glycosylase family 4
VNNKSKLRVIRSEWEGCNRCSLSQTRQDGHSVVFGWGAVPADYLFIYDAPSEEETAAGVPLLGRYGERLAQIIEDSDFPKGSWAMTPMVGCRPYFVLPATEDTEAQVRDRDPSDDELDACSSRVRSVIYYTDPRVIIAVGKTTWERLVKPKDRGETRTFESACGSLFATHVEGDREQVTYPVVPILTPKKIIANPSSAEHGPVATTVKALRRIQYYVTQLKKIEEVA